MSYLRAGFIGFIAALGLGAAAGAFEGASLAEKQHPKAAIYADAIAMALNCAAVFTLVLVPAACAGLYIKRSFDAQE